MTRKRLLKILYKELANRVGIECAGRLTAILLDSLDNFTRDVPYRNMRSIEIKYNDYFSTKYDFEACKYVE